MSISYSLEIMKDDEKTSLFGEPCMLGFSLLWSEPNLTKVNRTLNSEKGDFGRPSNWAKSISKQGKMRALVGRKVRWRTEGSSQRGIKDKEATLKWHPCDKPLQLLQLSHQDPWITLFLSMFCYNIDKMPWGLNSRLYRLANGKTGFVTHHFT